MELRKDTPKGMCQAKYCKNKARVSTQKGRTYTHSLCCSCQRIKQRETNPYRYYYDHLKQNAKRRGKEFTLQFLEFKEFCIANKYLEKTNKTEYRSIDRINPLKGYSIDNIQLTSRNYNSRKAVIENRLYAKYEGVPFDEQAFFEELQQNLQV